jgi:hypothetical protein
MVDFVSFKVARNDIDSRVLNGKSEDFEGESSHSVVWVSHSMGHLEVHYGGTSSCLQQASRVGSCCYLMQFCYGAR